MAALLRQGARRIGGCVLQRSQAPAASPAAAEERRRLAPRRMYTSEERVQQLAVWRERALRFRRFDKEFTKFLNASIGFYVIYRLLFPGDLVGQMDAAQAQADKK